MLTETVYVVPDCTDSGAVKVCCCQPDAVSPVKLIDASRAPVDDQMRPTCVPVSALAFQYRIAVMEPERATWNFMPSS